MPVILGWAAGVMTLSCLFGCGTDRPAVVEVGPKRPDDGLLFVARPTPTVKLTVTSLERTMSLMRARLAGIGVRNARVVRHGIKIKVLLPDGPAKQAARRVVGAPGRLAFYDWEKSVLGPDGKPHPLDESVTGGQHAGQPGYGTRSYYLAVKRASRFPATDKRVNGLVYGVDGHAKSVLCGPQATKADARASCRAVGKKPTSFVGVSQGHIIAQAQADGADKASQAAASDAYYVLKDAPALLGRDIKNPQQIIDSDIGQPDVSFDFTDAGRKKWQGLTRVVGRRGSDELLPGVIPGTVADHVAIVLDNKLISVPYVDPQQNPDGLDAANGSQISGVFTIESAQRVAILIKTGPLPLSLELVDNAS
jgi:SecD/SecF fusion protein